MRSSSGTSPACSGGDRHDEPEVRLDELALRRRVALVLAPRELALLGRGEQSPVADLAHVQLQRVVRGSGRRARALAWLWVVLRRRPRLRARRRGAPAFPSTDALSVARLPRFLRDDSMDEDLHEGAEVDAARTNRASLPDVYALVPFAPYRRLRPMCGIAGYSLGPDSAVGRTLAAQALLAGIAERGADASGTPIADRRSRHRDEAPRRRERAPRRDRRADERPSVLIHVRDFTKASRRRGEQPPDPPRVGRRCAQRRARTTTTCLPATGSSVTSLP